MNDPIFERFKTEMFSLNPIIKKGSTLYTMFRRVQAIIDSKSHTLDTLIKLYESYISHVNYVNRGRDKQYHTSILSIQEWIEGDKYLEDYENTLNNQDLDYYLYGEKKGKNKE